MSAIEAELTADLGGDPSAAERLLIQAATVKAVRLNLLAEQLLDGVEVQSDQHNVLAWANSLRHDLQALGLQRRSKDVTPDLSDYIAARSRPVEAAAA